MPKSFLESKYPSLHASKEVTSAARRKEARTGTPLSKDHTVRIENYLGRLEEFFDFANSQENPKDRETALRRYKKILYKDLLTKYEDIPDSYWKKQEGLMRERGQAGDWQSASPDDKELVKRNQAEALLSDQEASLEQWIDYFASSDSDYLPDYLKYWVFRSVTNLREYDKDKNRFPSRDEGDPNQFPDLNHEALAYVVDALLKKFNNQDPEFPYDIQEEESTKFKKFLKDENFAKLYAWSIEQISPIPEHLLEVTAGEWVKFDQGSDHRPLAQSLRGKGTGWCTAGENTARTHLAGGDFYVFYSNDDEGKPTIPRIAIRMEQDKISEVRGIVYKQNLDPHMGTVLAEKLEEFPDKDAYLKKEHDMSALTIIEKKMKVQEDLSREELIFLYEIDTKIQGFGYQDDPRVKELRSQRNSNEDMLIVFDCTRDQIAHNQREVTAATKAYLGPLFSGIFQLGMEHIGTAFPEGMVKRMECTIGGKTKDRLKQELRAKNITISEYAEDMMDSRDFTTSETQERLDLIRLTVQDIGFPSGATTDQIYQRAQDLGLELCPAETGPNLRLQNSTPDWTLVAMKQITDRNGRPNVFSLDQHFHGLRLSHYWAIPDRKWYPHSRFVFRLRKLET